MIKKSEVNRQGQRDGMKWIYGYADAALWLVLIFGYRLIRGDVTRTDFANSLPQGCENCNK